MDALERAQRACAGIDTSRPGAVGLMVKHFEAADQEAVLREREACAQVADNPLTAMMIRQRGDRCCVKCGHSISEAMSQAAGLCSDCNHARLREALEAKIAEDKALETANPFDNWPSGDAAIDKQRDEDALVTWRAGEKKSLGQVAYERYWLPAGENAPRWVQEPTEVRFEWEMVAQAVVAASDPQPVEVETSRAD